MKRRDFLKKLFNLLGLTTIISFIYPFLKFITPEKVAAKLKKLEIDRKDLQPGSAYKGSLNNKEVIVINDPKKGLIALSRVCTHLGCLIDYDRSINSLVCPCHGAKFTVDGHVISGPAPKPLERLPLAVVGNRIIVG